MTTTTIERCDRCGARSKVSAALSSGAVLNFCGHHGNEQEGALEAQGAVLMWHENGE
jgi:hypothetical protein